MLLNDDGEARSVAFSPLPERYGSCFFFDWRRFAWALRIASVAFGPRNVASTVRSPAGTEITRGRIRFGRSVMVLVELRLGSWVSRR